MGNPSNQYSPNPPDSGWSNRILILAIAGILFLTMYPFRLNIHALANGASPFLLGKSEKSGLVDALLNVLLFVPFGFGLGEKLRAIEPATYRNIRPYDDYVPEGGDWRTQFASELVAKW